LVPVTAAARSAMGRLYLPSCMYSAAQW
jgi:hypothetical protein